MRVLRTIQVVNVRWFNATAWYGIKLSKLLNEAGHETLTLCLPGTEALDAAEAMGQHPIPLPLTSRNPFTVCGIYGGLARLIAGFRPDVVDCHRGEMFFLFALLKRRLPFALVRTRGDQRLPKNTFLNRLLHRTAADAVVATNSVMADHFRKVIGMPADRVHTVIGGVDASAFRFDGAGRIAERTRYGFTDADIVIGLLGRFDAVKGQQELIEASARLAVRGLRVKLLLIGFPTDTSQREIDGWIEESRARSVVVCTGKVPDVAATISACDLGVVASRYSETIARAALEMMACGRPLISTRVGVMPDLLPEEALCTPHDVDALTLLLERAVSDDAFRARLTEHAVRRMADLDDGHFLDATLSVYEKAMRR